MVLDVVRIAVIGELRGEDLREVAEEILCAGEALDRLTVVLCGRYPVELLLVEVDRLWALAIDVVEPLAVQIGGPGDGGHRLRGYR